MFLRRITPLYILFLLVAWGCSSSQDATNTPPVPNAVASYNAGVITKDQLEARFDELLPCCKGRYQGDDGVRALIKQMVLPTVVVQAIKQDKIDLRENLREKMGDLTDKLNTSFLHIKFHEQILNNNEKYKDIREEYEYQKRILNGLPLSERYKRLVQVHGKIHPKIAKEVETISKEYLEKLRDEASIRKNYDVLTVKVSDQELKEFYKDHKEGLHAHEYQVPEKVRVKEIIITAKDEKDKNSCKKCQKDEAGKRAESALSELRSGAEFESVAQKYGDDNSYPVKAKWVARGSREAPFDKAVFSSDIDEISQVIENNDTFSIVKTLDHRPGRFKAFDEIIDKIEREYRWQKGEQYLKENKDRILFTIDAKPYTIGDFIKQYTRDTPDHECHHMEKMDSAGHKGGHKEKPSQLCDFAHNELEEQKDLVDRMIDQELIIEDTYSQMIDVEHKEDIAFVTASSLYPIFHKEKMDNLIHVTDEMVESYYQGNREAYQYPASAKLNIIITKGGEKEEEKKRAFEKAKKAHKELKPSFFSFEKGKEFAEIARKYSEDEATASRGGRLDVDIHECRNAIEYALMHGFHKTIFQLEQGEISDVFEFGGDYYIVQIRELENRKKMIFEEIRAQVKRDLMDQKHENVMENWEDDLLKSAGFVIYDKALKDVTAKLVSDDEPHEAKGS